MGTLTVALALLSALAAAATSVLQRRAAVDQTQRDDGPRGERPAPVRRAWQLVRRGPWLAGAACLVLSGGCQAAALAVGSLAVVQPLLATDLLFTLLLGTLVFRHRPDARTWVSFVLLAAGLAVFLAAAAPSAGTATGEPDRWLVVGAGAAVAVGGLVCTGRVLHGPSRAAVLGSAAAVCFAVTAALVKEVTGRLPQGAGPLFATGYLYAGCAAGLLSFLLLQSTLRAGTLTASQPALTLGDAVISVVLGPLLFHERLALAGSALPAALGACAVVAGTVGLSRSASLTGWDRPRPGGT